MKVFSLLMILFAFNSYAVESFVTRIYSVETDLVKFENARVGIAPKALKLESLPGELVKVTIADGNQLISLEKLEDLEVINTINSPFIDEDYRPTILKNFSAAKKMLDNMRDDFVDQTQSYNLAHVWTFEEYKNNQHLSEKAFLFFSDSFIRRTHQKWWFHVSPLMRYKQHQHKVAEVILDKTLRTSPISLGSWSAQLMGEKIHCPVIDRFSQVKAARDCSILKSNMYYWQPRDLELLEQQQLFRVNFFDFELENAFSASFGGHFFPK